MTEDELWMVIGIFLILFVVIILYFLFSHQDFLKTILQIALNLKIPTPWKKLG